MNRKERLMFIDAALNKLYPNPEPPLEFDTPYQLLVAVILSAQCTDERVNIVTKVLFQDHPHPKDIARLNQKELQEYIKSCGLYRNKAKNILLMTHDIIKKYQGEIPRDFSQLVELAGVGEKTAGVVIAQAFNQPAFPVDTHILRIAKRLMLSRKSSANQVSRDLQALFPVERWADLHLQIIFHGRKVCKARSFDCSNCSLLPACPTGKKAKNSCNKIKR